ncbi:MULTISPECIES: hypothetical protein [unclassified Caballeronia]|uniref:lipopolysaccharide biosynthesis protein n=1 Tax=unclassified Caballeronia TaxID=2646786 RepID=UPI0020281AAC|nr:MULTISPECIES: hypothetical protein [unclassified Caballeronia]
MARRGLGLTAGYAVSVTGGVVSLMAYARVLGPQVYGQLAVYLALVEAFQAVVFQWHRLAFVRFWTASARKDDADAYLRTSHLVWLAIALVALAAIALALAFEAGSRQVWLAVGVLALAKSAALYTQEIARAGSAVLRYAFASFLLTVGATLAGLIAWSLTHSMTLTLYGTAAIFVLQAILCGFDRVAVMRHARFSVDQLRAMLHYGLPLIPVFIATTAMTRLDRPILAMFEQPAVVGIYAAASGLITNAISAACLLIVTPCYPWLLREKASRSAAGHRAFHARLGLLMLACVFAVSIVVMVLRDVALPLMLGPSIGNAALPLVLPLLAIATIAAFRAHFFDQAYHLHARTKALMSINLLTMTLAVAATYFGARMAGCGGMVRGLLAVNVVALLISAAFARGIVDLGRVVCGAILLSAFAAAALAAGELSNDVLNRAGHAGIWTECLSAIVALSLFCGMCVGANVGSIREALRGKL